MNILNYAVLGHKYVMVVIVETLFVNSVCIEILLHICVE